MSEDAKTNKVAWEEAYANKNDYDQDLLEHIRRDPDYYLAPPLQKALAALSLHKDTEIMQFCSNNGRELLGVCKAYGCKGIGFDIAENMIADANHYAKALEVNVTFEAADLLTIDFSKRAPVDVVFMTVGSLCWFKSLDDLFKKVSEALKDNGVFIVHDSHPFTYSTLAAPGESNYDPNYPERPVNHYDRQEPWVEGGGMGYMSTLKESAVFISYSHTMAEIINALSRHHLWMASFEESSIDYASVFGTITTVSLPFSMLFKARKDLRNR